MKIKKFKFLVLLFLLVVVSGCEIDLGFDNTGSINYEITGEILEGDSLQPLDSVKIEIYYSEFMDYTHLSDRLFTNSLGGFDFNFSGCSGRAYYFKVSKDDYEVRSPTNGLGIPVDKFYINRGINDYYIEMEKIYPIKLNRTILESSFIYSHSACFDSTYTELENLPEVFNPKDCPFWPFEQFIFISDSTSLLMDNSSNISEPFPYEQSYNNLEISTDYGIFEFTGHKNNEVYDYGYNYIVVRNYAGNSLSEEKSGRGVLSNVTLDSLKNSLTENDTLYYKRYKFKYMRRE